VYQWGVRTRALSEWPCSETQSTQGWVAVEHIRVLCAMAAGVGRGGAFKGAVRDGGRGG